MALKLFIGFDGSYGYTSTGGQPSSWTDCPLPPGVYAEPGVLTLSQSSSNAFYTNFGAPRTGGGAAMAATNPGGTWSVTNFISGGGGLIAVQRTAHSIPDEVWITWDARNDYATSLSATQTHTSLAVFRWGDVELWHKSTSTPGTATWVFSVKNAGVEVATVTVPCIAASGAWVHFCAHVKLHASTGIIEFKINDIPQSVVLTGQNTVSVNAASSSGTLLTADFIHIGAVHGSYNTSTGGIYIGMLDNIYIDDAAFPAGRPRGDIIGLGTTSTDVGWTAVGTSPTTVPNALDSATDAKAARGTTAGSSTLLDMASFSTSGLSDFVGFHIILKRASGRDYQSVRKISAGVSVGGVHTMGTIAAGTTLLATAHTTPPATTFTHIIERVYGSALTLGNIGSAKVRLLVT